MYKTSAIINCILVIAILIDSIVIDYNYIILRVSQNDLHLHFRSLTVGFNPFNPASRGRLKKIFDGFYLVYWVHLHDICLILGGWFGWATFHPCIFIR